MRTLLDVCERRWALRVIWELRSGPQTFRGVRQACGGISPSVLQRRFHAWRELGIIENIPRLGYRLTAAGEQLFLILARLDKWAATLPTCPDREEKTL
jgi:DNA-binding HxlR family transcriptional regulator